MSTWQKLCSLEALPERTLTPFTLAGRDVVVFRDDAKIHAFIDWCSHQAVRLSEFGEVVEGELVCYAHGARFALGTGKPLCQPATEALTRFATRVEDGELWIEL